MRLVENNKNRYYFDTFAPLSFIEFFFFFGGICDEFETLFVSAY